ncbi:MAG: ROK family protein [Proteobacteria bacterium]|nr:ROK family protein [Pseudomonadota bacterium]
MRRYAGVELGGTKCICVLGNAAGEVRERAQLPTRDPQATLAAIAAVLREWHSASAPLTAIGIAAFGPLDLRAGSPGFGRIGATPKQGWAHTDVVGIFRQRFDVPIGITTDVIGAALAEGRWGGARGLSDFAYVTVGTGVGAGLIHDGRPLIGCHHPELGHARIARAAGDDWPGHCRFHGDCVEGLASGPAIAARCGASAADLPAAHPVWPLVVHALGQLAYLLVVSVAPQRILLGGGVLVQRGDLFDGMRAHLAASLNDYLDIAELKTGLDRYLVPPGLGADAGPLGALAVAIETHVA